MAQEEQVGCARPTGGVVGEQAPEEPETSPPQPKQEKKMLSVGQKVPDFSAPAYHQGKFINIKLSDYLGKWVVLCFYPGDFTFV